MSVSIEGYVGDGMACNVFDFKVNGVAAEQEWFVSITKGTCPEDCDGYDCHDIAWHALKLSKVRNALPESLDRTLSGRDIEQVQDWLIDSLPDGYCGMCV